MVTVVSVVTVVSILSASSGIVVLQTLLSSHQSSVSKQPVHRAVLRACVTTEYSVIVIVRVSEDISNNHESPQVTLK